MYNSTFTTARSQLEEAIRSILKNVGSIAYPHKLTEIKNFLLSQQQFAVQVLPAGKQQLRSMDGTHIILQTPLMLKTNLVLVSHFKNKISAYIGSALNSGLNKVRQ